MGDFAFPGTSYGFPPHCGTGDRAFLSEPQPHTHGLGTSLLLAVRRTKLCAAGRRVHKRSSADRPSVLPLPFPVHLMWGFQMYTSTLYSRLRVHGQQSEAGLGAWGL